MKIIFLLLRAPRKLFSLLSSINMGRGKNSNKMYISMKEWTEQFGGKKEGEPKDKHGFKPLPFDCCAISLTAFEDPYCTEDGNVYDLVYV